jgi:hypothetical protein
MCDACEYLGDNIHEQYLAVMKTKTIHFVTQIRLNQLKLHKNQPNEDMAGSDL